MKNLSRAMAALVIAVASCAAPQGTTQSIAQLTQAIPSTLLGTVWTGVYHGTGKYTGHAFAYAFLFYEAPGGVLRAKYEDLGPYLRTTYTPDRLAKEVMLFGRDRDVEVVSDERGGGYLIAANGNVTFMATPTAQGKELHMSRLFGGFDVGVHSTAQGRPMTETLTKK